MVNAHCADALVCISNCDKITPGMLMAAHAPSTSRRSSSRAGPWRPARSSARTRATASRSSASSTSSTPMIASSDSEGQRRRGTARHRAVGLPDVRLVLRHVHGQQHELPQRGARPRAAGAAARCSRRTRAAGSCFEGGLHSASSSWRSAATRTVTIPCCPRRIATYGRVRERHGARHRHGPGSTNTVLHILAIAHEAGVDFTMKDIDRLSRKVPNICKVAPAGSYHVEDVHRAGGIFTILGELETAGLIQRDALTVHTPSMGDAIDANDLHRASASPAAKARALAAPGGVPTQVAFSQDKYFKEADLDVEKGCIRDIAHAYSKDGGLAVLYGNIAVGGCIVKTAGVDDIDPEVRGQGAHLPLAGHGLRRHHGGRDRRGRRRRRSLRRPQGRPRHAGNALPDVVLEGQRASARRARSSPMDASRAGRRGSASATCRPRRARAAPSASSKRATRSASTSRTAASTSSSTPRPEFVERRKKMDAKGAPGVDAEPRSQDRVARAAGPTPPAHDERRAGRRARPVATAPRANEEIGARGGGIRGNGGPRSSAEFTGMKRRSAVFDGEALWLRSRARPVIQLTRFSASSTHTRVRGGPSLMRIRSLATFIVPGRNGHGRVCHAELRRVLDLQGDSALRAEQRLPRTERRGGDPRVRARLLRVALQRLV